VYAEPAKAASGAKIIMTTSRNITRYYIKIFSYLGQETPEERMRAACTTRL
jgi:hypothetical protein